MNNIYIFLVAILATWRISALLSYEAGPFGILEWIREKVGIIHDDEGEKIAVHDNIFAQVLDCVWCISVWIGAFVTIWIWLSPVFVWFLLPLAFSAGAIMIEKVNHG